MNNPISQVGNLEMIDDNSSGQATYDVYASRPTFYSGGSWFNKSIMNRAMVIYEGEDDFGMGGTKDSYYYGTNIKAIACCNITPFKIVAHDEDKEEDHESDQRHDKHTKDTRNGRMLLEEDEVEILTLQEYKEIFGVDYDPADWE